MERNWKWYFVTKIVLTYCEKNCSSDREKKIKLFEITRTIYSNSERYWKQNAFLTCSWRFLKSNKLEQLGLKLEKIIRI